jgi:hypothetical protein
MRTTTALLLLAIAAPADACPWWGRCCRPRPVIFHCPPPVVRVVEVRPAEPVKDPDAAPDGWCHVRGRVVYVGSPVPVRKPIPKSGGAFTEEWVVNGTNRGIRNAMVWLSPEPNSDEWDRLRSTGPNRLRQLPSFKADQVYPGLSRKGEYTLIHGEPMRAYHPHVQAVQAGSTLTIRNLSLVPDNPKWTSSNNGEYSPLVPPDNRWVLKELKAGRFPIHVSSSFYPWISAYVQVFDHPYFAVTNDDGEFEIKFAPKGNLRLVVWQETTGYRNGREGRFGEPIKVPNGRLDLGDISLKPNP